MSDRIIGVKFVGLVLNLVVSSGLSYSLANRRVSYITNLRIGLFSFLFAFAGLFANHLSVNVLSELFDVAVDSVINPSFLAVWLVSWLGIYNWLKKDGLVVKKMPKVTPDGVYFDGGEPVQNEMRPKINQEKGEDRQSPLFRFVVAAAIILLLLFFVVIVASVVSDPDETQSSAEPSLSVSQSLSPSPSPTMTINPVALPKNGQILYYDKKLDYVAPLTISTEGTDSYFVKLVSTKTWEPVLWFFVRAGQSVDIDVPLGRYELRYACGKEWYGLENLFGEDTAYYKADEFFRFKVSGTGYSGWTVELYAQRDGNLSVDEIKKEDF